MQSADGGNLRVRSSGENPLNSEIRKKAFSNQPSKSFQEKGGMRVVHIYTLMGVKIYIKVSPYSKP
jgi:hypothetical protein